MADVLILREIRNLAALLRITRVAIQYHAANPALHALIQAGNTRHHDRRALRVAAARDNGVGTLRCRLIEQSLRLLNGTSRSSIGQGITAQISGVPATDTLAGDSVFAVLLLELAAGRWTYAAALELGTLAIERASL